MRIFHLPIGIIVAVCVCAFCSAQDPPNPPDNTPPQVIQTTAYTTMDVHPIVKATVWHPGNGQAAPVALMMDNWAEFYVETLFGPWGVADYVEIEFTYIVKPGAVWNPVVIDNQAHWRLDNCIATFRFKTYDKPIR